MGRLFDRSGDALRRALYASQLAVLFAALLFVALPLEGFARVPVALLFALLVVATAVGLWRAPSDGDGRGLPGADDVTYDPFADPGQAARDRWERAVSRLPGGDDED
jgi:hypothetical protein